MSTSVPTIPDSRPSPSSQAAAHAPAGPRTPAGWRVRNAATGTVRRWLVGSTFAVLVALANFTVWQYLNPPLATPDVPDQVAGLAYNGFQRWDSPLDRRFPSAEQVDADLALLSTITRRIRTYSSSELPELPSLAEKHGLRVTAGVWLDKREASNRREIEAVKLSAHASSSIDRVIVGNESLLRGDLTPRELIADLDELRGALRVPVSTAEPWHIWLRYPELARHVDFITVHLLPYWEGVPADQALDYAMQRLNAVRERFPNRHVVIGEIGWPSHGDRIDGAFATPAAQATFTRDFLALARQNDSDYFLMEAIDQPWKAGNEGRAGAYWGLLTADRAPKFAMQGPVQGDSNWFDKALFASLFALAPIAAFAAAFPSWRKRSRLFFSAMIQGAVSVVIWLVAIPFDYYLGALDWASLALLLPALLAMVAILLVNGFEFAEMFWRGNLRRSFAPKPLIEGGREPLVSVHLACCNEPPEMVIATLDSLAALDYRNFEVIVVDNNTQDEALWKPVEAHIAQLGERFRFFHLPSWPGFKAGALNFALEQTDPGAEVVGVVDADYVVRADWLRALVGHFADTKVAVVQAPQAHRDWANQVFRRMMNFEYEGFFRIGMHHRNERDAIIQHGTMTLIRAQALREHGRWSEWCICEDAELGLRLMKAGLSTVYVDRVFGEGLTPDDFAAFGKQRRRWALGAMQILKAHWRSLLLAGDLTQGQRFHFVTGWLSWFGDALHLVFALAAMAWTVGIIASPRWFTLPIMLFMIPLFGFFAGKALFGPLLYSRRVDCGLRDIFGGALASMALSHSIARGVFAGLAQRRSVFEVTRKGTVAKRAGRWGAVREQSFLLTGLLVSTIGMMLTRKPGHIESALWIAILLLQAIPYVATLTCNLLAGRPARAERVQSGAPDEAVRRIAQSRTPARPGPVHVPAHSPGSHVPLPGAAAAAAG